MRGLRVVILALALGGCQIGAGFGNAPVGKGGPAPDAMTGGTIEVTALDGVGVQSSAGAGKVALKPLAPTVMPEDLAKAAPADALIGGAVGPEPNPAAPKAGPDMPKTAPVEPAPAPVPAALKSPQARACEKSGGSYAVAGRSGANTCVKPTGEGAKSCDRQTDCTGLCLARSRTCAPVTPLFGCNDILQADGSRVTLCID